ncbi:unnamed protein product, partial [marine sediment metagenome]
QQIYAKVRVAVSVLGLEQSTLEVGNKNARAQAAYKKLDFTPMTLTQTAIYQRERDDKDLGGRCVLWERL